MAAAQPRSPGRSFSVGEVLMALGILSTGLFFLLGAMNITALGTYARIGPRFFPYLVGAGLLLAGFLLLWQSAGAHKISVRGYRAAIAPAPENWVAVSWIAGGLILNVALMESAGYILSTACLFFFAARGLGSRRYFINVLAGLSLAVVTFLAFTRLLDLHLPLGLLEGLIA
jgi:putative tricarboxylic transport membrane protein